MNRIAAGSLVAFLRGRDGPLHCRPVIITRRDSSLPEGARRVDDIVSGGVLTLFARFVEHWGDARRGMKVLFALSAIDCAAAVVGLGVYWE